MRLAIALVVVAVSGTTSAVAYDVSTSAAEAPVKRAAPRPIGITHVTVIDVEHGTRLRDHTIVIEGERISTIGLSSQVRVPDGYGIVEGRGRFVIPGLIDTHSHFARLDDSAATSAGTNHPLERFVPFGVTTLHEASLYAVDVANAALRDRRDEGAPLPRFRVSAGVGRWYIASAGATDVRDLIQRLLDGSVSGVVDVGGLRALGGGRSPQDVTLADTLIRAMVERRVWLEPLQAMGSDGAMPFLRRFHDAGGMIIAGTDGPRFSGAAVHDVLRQLVAAGLTPMEALRAATFDAARAMIGGRFIDGAERQALISRLAASHTH